MPNENCICSQQVHQIAQQLAGPVDLTPANKGQVPDDRGGLYAIYKKNPLPNSPECLWVGRAGHSGGSLRHRIFAQHYGGGGVGAGSDLVQQVQSRGLANNKAAAQAWIAANCEVRWLPLPDIEYALKQLLNPSWSVR